jgi:hypothetical protein
MVAVAQIEVIPERRLQRDLVCAGGGGGFDTVTAAPVAFLPLDPTTQIEARVGRAIIFLFSGMDTFCRPAQTDESCEGFIGADKKCVIFIGKLPSARD